MGKKRASKDGGLARRASSDDEDLVEIDLEVHSRLVRTFSLTRVTVWSEETPFVPGDVVLAQYGKWPLWPALVYNISM
jgi:hypothetical protein